MNRANLALMIVLIAQLALVVVVLGEEDTADTQLARGGALLPDLDADTITALSIEDSEGLSLQLTRNADGQWVLPDYEDFPAAENTVNLRLDALVRLDADQLVTRTADNLRRFRVADDSFFRRMTIEQGGSRSVLYVGDTAAGADRYFRVAGESEVYLNSDPGQAALSTDPTTWVDTVYFSAPPEDLVSITIDNAATIDNADGGVQLFQTEGAWQLPVLASNEMMNATEVSRITSRFTTYRLDDPVGRETLPEYGLDDPTVTVTLAVRVPDPTVDPADIEAPTPDPTDPNATPTAPEIPTIVETRTLVIGAATGEGGYYTKYSENDFVVTTPATFVDELAALTRDDFVQSQPFSVFGG